MKYQYRAKQRSGKPASGEIEAVSTDEARQRLRGQGLFVLSIAAQGARTAAVAKPSTFNLRSVASGTDILTLISQLTIMSQSGVDLAESLKNLSQQCTKPALKAVLERVYNDVSAGITFSDALRRHPNVFNETFIAAVTAGERSGTISAVLERLTYLIRGEMRLRSTVWSMLMYPLVLCGVTFMVLNALVFFVLPQFSKVFIDLGKAPPPLTQALLGIGEFARDHGLLILVAILVLGIAAFCCRKTKIVRRFRDRLLLNGIVIRGASRAISTGRTFRLMGTMLLSGVPLVECIHLCRDAARNSLFQQLFTTLEHEVLQGSGISKTLLATPFLPAGAAHMVATAERSGKLGPVLQSVGEFYEDEGERQLRDMIKIVEPAIILGLGAVVAVVVLSVVLPLLDVTTMSH